MTLDWAGIFWMEYQSSVNRTRNRLSVTLEIAQLVEARFACLRAQVWSLASPMPKQCSDLSLIKETKKKKKVVVKWDYDKHKKYQRIQRQGKELKKVNYGKKILSKHLCAKGLLLKIYSNLEGGTVVKALDSQTRGPEFDPYHFMCQSNALVLLQKY